MKPISVKNIKKWEIKEKPVDKPMPKPFEPLTNILDKHKKKLGY